MNDKVPVYGQRRAGVYLLSEIYNPANVNSSVQNVGKVIPAVGSLVIDDSVGQHNTIYIVYGVDAVTFKSTLVPAAIPLSTDIGDQQVITYGNNVYMLYYKQDVMHIYELTTDTKFISGKVYYTRAGEAPNYTYSVATVTPGHTVTPNTYFENKEKTIYQGMVDNKISIFGDRAATYSLYKGTSITADTSADLISHYYLNDQGVVVESGRIPMDSIQVPATNGVGELITATAKVPRMCYSAVEIEDDSPYVFAVFDSEGFLIAQITMLGHHILGISELQAQQWPITRFYVTANQFDTEDNKCYLVRGQNVGELLFYPHINYANGDAISEAGIDNTKLFIYGKSEISTATAGSEFTVLFKYYLGNNESTSEERDYNISQTGRYIYTTTIVKIIDSFASAISKISPAIAAVSSSRYSVLPLIYYKNKQMPTVGEHVSGFSGNTFGTSQVIDLMAYETDTSTPDTVSVKEFHQAYNVTLFNPVNTPQVPFYYRDEPSMTSNFYGKDTITTPRPRMVHIQTSSEDCIRISEGPDHIVGIYRPIGILVDGVYPTYSNGIVYFGYCLADNSWRICLSAPTTAGYDEAGAYLFTSLPAAEPSLTPIGLSLVSADSPIVSVTPVAEPLIISNRYFVPDNIFGNKETFLNSFYYNADPPKYGGAAPVRPTHFQVRKLDIQNGDISVLSTSPVSIDNFYSDIAIPVDLSNDDSVIFEFLYRDDTMAADSYEHLFGVPVRIAHGAAPGILTVSPMELTVESEEGQPIDVATILAEASNGAIVSFEYTGLPAGITTNNGVISGSNNVLGTTNAVCVVSAQECASKTVAITFNCVGHISVDPKEESVYEAKPFSIPIYPIASTGSEVTLTPYGTLPAGVSLVDNSIEGTPTVPGVYEIKATATATGCATRVVTICTLTVVALGTITLTPYSKTFNQGDTVDEQLVAMASTGEAVTFHADNLPYGLECSATGRITGTIGRGAQGQYLPVITLTAEHCWTATPTIEMVVLVPTGN